MSDKKINYRVGDRNLKYYIFDWDDNILRMPTHIHLERKCPDGRWEPHAVSTSTFSLIRNDTDNYRPPENDWEKAFKEFRDFAHDDESKFLKDARAAIDHLLTHHEKPPPSFNTFKQSLIEGRLFAIVTARGHKSETLRKGIELFIERVLSPKEKATMLCNLRGYIACYLGEEKLHGMTDDDVLGFYLSLNKYHAVTSPQFHALIRGKIPDTQQSEIRKQYAIYDFIEHIFNIIEKDKINKPVSVGFSDDDPANIEAIERYVKETLGKRFPSVRFVIYDTSNPDIEKGRKNIVSGQLDLGL